MKKHISSHLLKKPLMGNLIFLLQWNFKSWTVFVRSRSLNVLQDFFRALLTFLISAGGPEIECEVAINSRATMLQSRLTAHYLVWLRTFALSVLKIDTAQKMKFSIKDFLNKCDQMGNFIFCAVRVVGNLFNFVIELPSPHPQW